MFEIRLILLCSLIVFISWLLYRLSKWTFSRIYTFFFINKLAKKRSLSFVIYDRWWFFNINGDGKVSFIVETENDVYYIHLCGDFIGRNSYIFSNETHWIRRHYTLIGKGAWYTDKHMDVKEVYIPLERITFKRETIVYLFSPKAVGYGRIVSSNYVAPFFYEDEIPNGILHCGKSFRKFLERNILCK